MYQKLASAAIFTLISGLNCAPARVAVPCEMPDVDASPNVAGIYDYFGVNPFAITGTITFEQEGDTVRVTDTTYDFTDNRRLMGEATIDGNTLAIPLVPINGETDYRADVIFRFSDDGDTFCVEYNDTNGDAGDLGDFQGRRRR